MTNQPLYTSKSHSLCAVKYVWYMLSILYKLSQLISHWNSLHPLDTIWTFHLINCICGIYCFELCRFKITLTYTLFFHFLTTLWSLKSINLTQFKLRMLSATLLLYAMFWAWWVNCLTRAIEVWVASWLTDYVSYVSTIGGLISFSMAVLPVTDF